MSPNKFGEEGVTLMEMVIGAALLALVIFIGSSVFSRLQKSARHDHNRTEVQKLAQSLMSLVKRDAAVQAISGLEVIGGTTVRITRLAQGADDESSTYQVTFQSACEDFPASTPLLELTYSASNRPVLYQNPHSCLKSLNCPAGRYPTVRVTLSGSGIPASYPQKIFPGVSLCAALISDQVQLVLEAPFIPGNREPLAQVHQKVFMLPSKTSSDLTILPN